MKPGDKCPLCGDGELHNHTDSIDIVCSGTTLMTIGEMSSLKCSACELRLGGSEECDRILKLLDKTQKAVEGKKK